VQFLVPASFLLDLWDNHSMVEMLTLALTLLGCLVLSLILETFLVLVTLVGLVEVVEVGLGRILLAVEMVVGNNKVPTFLLGISVLM